MTASHLPTVIYTATGQRAGGLSDRLRGIAALYRICQAQGLNFQINFTAPFALTDFLLPNTYDWTPTAAAKTRPRDFLNAGADELAEAVAALSRKESPVCLFTNCGCADYGAAFAELFRPSDELQNLIAEHAQKAGGAYVAASFRFQDLLGDLNERHCPELPAASKEKMLALCLDHLRAIHAENPEVQIFVASDSRLFLTAARTLPFVYAVPGEIAHIDYPGGGDHSVYLKVFLDYFMLAGARKIYQVVEGPMYGGGFAGSAAALRRTPLATRRSPWTRRESPWSIVIRDFFRRYGRSFFSFRLRRRWWRVNVLGLQIGTALDQSVPAWRRVKV
ncbi:MAG: hypothetical protein LBP75_00570 [Planctomycetota bacterium]|jgi:hypothetical protein|nr:hypothetical protein [Planctomycetota bacterium]